MNAVYALAAYPAGKLADHMNHYTLLGVGLWGLHMALTHGLLATMVADTVPEALRGTAFGCFNLVSGLAMLLASALAGWLWDTLGAQVTFSAGAIFALVSVGILAVRRRKTLHAVRGR
jgi:MFS family permease